MQTQIKLTVQHHVHTTEHSTAGSYSISFATVEKGTANCSKTGPYNSSYELFKIQNSHHAINHRAYFYWKTDNNRQGKVRPFYLYSTVPTQGNSECFTRKIKDIKIRKITFKIIQTKAKSKTINS